MPVLSARSAAWWDARLERGLVSGGKGGGAMAAAAREGFEFTVVVLASLHTPPEPYGYILYIHSVLRTTVRAATASIVEGIMLLLAHPPTHHLKKSPPPPYPKPPHTPKHPSHRPIAPCSYQPPYPLVTDADAGTFTTPITPTPSPIASDSCVSQVRFTAPLSLLHSPNSTHEFRTCL
jgi:hypothetical protein